jgi:hypothetical protein
VYKLSKLPGIGWKHFLALFRILRETKNATQGTGVAARKPVGAAR